MRIANLRQFSTSAVIGTVGWMPLLVLPAMVGVLVDEAALSESFAGWVASANFLGFALVALVMAFRMHRVHLRKTAAIALAIAVAGDVASSLIASETTTFLLLRFVTGLASGAAQITAIAAIARFENAERGYGLYVALQFLIGGIVCYVLPVYSAQIGDRGMFLMFAALDVLALALVRQLPGRALDGWVGAERRTERSILFAAVTLLALVGYGLFEVAATAQYTYLQRLGVGLAFSSHGIGAALMVASLAGIPGASAIVVIGTRFGTLAPLALGFGIAILGLILLIASGEFACYVMAGICLGFSWAFCLPFIQTLMASLDPNGSAVAAGSSAATVGVAIGPGLAASVAAVGQYQRVFQVAIALLIVSLTSFCVCARKAQPLQVEVQR